jgi:Cys-tRNA(Pro)/Cys-tRNA(Cys) deacylase
MSYERVIARLDVAGVAYRLLDHPPFRTVADIEADGRFPMTTIVKTVVFRLKAGPWLLVALHGLARVDYRKLAAALGVKRGDIRNVPPEEVEAELGYEVGGVPPIPPTPEVRVVFDQAITTLAVITCGTGLRTQTLEIAMPDLLALIQPVVADVAEARI